MISIITVVLNGASTIENTIQSVINQNYSQYEYIIIDGVSTDGTMSIIEKYRDKIDIVVSEPDKGVYDAMNKGIMKAKGDWIYFLGCDDVLSNPFVLNNIFQNSKHENYDVIYGNVLFKQSNKIYDGEFDAEKMSNRSICHQAIFYRKHLFQMYGYFDITYKAAADYIFNIYLYCSNPSRWKFINEVIAIYNEEGISMIPEKKYLNNSFAIRYDNFRKLESKYILSKIFWSSYFRYIINHDIKSSFKYLLLIFKDIGVGHLFINLFTLLRNKYLIRN